MSTSPCRLQKPLQSRARARPGRHSTDRGGKRAGNERSVSIPRAASLHDGVRCHRYGPGVTADTLALRRGTQDPLFDAPSPGVESFAEDGASLVRWIMRRDDTSTESRIVRRTDSGDLAADFDLAWLHSAEPPPVLSSGERAVRVVDLFCGCGGLTLGLREAARGLGTDLEVLLAVDFNAAAVGVYSSNFPEADTRQASVESLFDGDLGAPLTRTEARVASSFGSVDVLVGGPPCQGHSDLNNHTRRDDPKNGLYLRMVRAAEVIRPAHVLIENVPGVLHAKDSVVINAWRELARLGYSVDGDVIHAARVGVPQRRRRYCLVASRAVAPSLSRVANTHAVPERSLRWAITDLLGADAAITYDTSAVHSEINRRRIDYLFDNDLHDLPDEERPDCHRLKPHSYRAVYGRMWWDRPAPTITSGFGSTGQGRFVHPAERRTLTPHEAARVQFFPDHFSFADAGRRALQEMIGNAVPPKLGYVIGLDLLR